MCNLYSITTNQAAIIALFRVMNRYVGNLPSMPGVFPDYPAPVVNAGAAAQTHGSALAVENGYGIAARRAVDAADRRTVLGTNKPRLG